MHVDHQPALGGDLAELGHRAAAVLHGALEMRDAADDIDAEVERADGVLPGGRRAVEAVLREGDELQVDIGRDLLLHVEQRFHRQQPVVAGVDMAADGEQAHRHRPVAIGERALAHGLMRQQRLQLAPQPDAFEQRARRVDARNAVGQRRIHVEMRIDEGRRDQVAGWRRPPCRPPPRSPARSAAMRSPEMPMSATLPSGRMPPLTMMSKPIFLRLSDPVMVPKSCTPFGRVY